MEEKKRNTHGGRRKGAGRPKGDSRLYAFRTDGKMAEYIDSHNNKTQFIRECISHMLMAETTVHSDDNRPHSLEQMGDVFPATNIAPLTIPFFDQKVVAGFPIPLNNDELSQDIELLRMLCPNPEASYLIRVCGDSMVDAGICNGDIVIVDKSNRTPSEQDVAVCELNGEYTLKHVVMKGGKGWLVPDNPEYPEIEINDNDSFTVWGTVTYIIHRPRR